LKSPAYEWLEPQPVAMPAAFQDAVGGHPLLAELLIRRGFNTIEKARPFLDPRAYNPCSPDVLPDLSRAADRLEGAIHSQELIGVWGDFDVDGQTSTALLVSGLRRLGARVTWHIPVRARESHGVNLPNLTTFIDSGVQLVLTCDTGITAHDEVAYAHNRNVDMIITDHHTLPPELPAAYAVVNPQRLASDHPLASLCGVGCAYKLLEELYLRRDRGDDVTQFLDLVALGMVADLAALTGDGRYLVQRGLEVLRGGQRLGLQVMLKKAELSNLHLTEEHISYVLAPRLNAVGRLDDANPLVEFLTSTDQASIEPIAESMERLNSRRKLLCDQVFEGALSQIEAQPALLDNPALVLNHPDWPAGVIGIVASRLVELYNRPAILLASPPGQLARASARSVEGINITAAIAAHQELLLAFGGHPMAAGFAIDPAKIPEFRHALNRSLKKATEGRPSDRTLAIDAILPLEQLNLELVETLERMAPFGPGNSAPVLATRGLRLQSPPTKVGKSGEHLQILVEDAYGSGRKVIWWQGEASQVPEERFDLAYTVRASNFRGQAEIQIEWLHARVIEESLRLARPSRYTILDYRQEPDPAVRLCELLKDSSDTQVWAEGETPPQSNGVSRYNLAPAATLVIWSVPPGRAELTAALQVVAPKKAALFANQAASDGYEDFLTRLAAMLNYAIHHNEGRAEITRLAAALSQREITIRKGLDCLVALGQVSLCAQDGDRLQVAAGNKTRVAALPQIEIELRSLLQETAAFRAYFTRANPDQLLEFTPQK
jgi:single-stranded-DNA-specific exonuclease